MADTLLELAYRLTRAGEPFVVATVVWCERPTSAKPGARAIIQGDGKITGWIGGSCAQPLVLREAARLLREGGDPYLLRLGAPAATTSITREHVRVFPMTCASGGTLDIYMEPHLPQPKLLLIGDSPVIVALLRLAEVVDFAVTQVEHFEFDPARVTIDERSYVLVASHGQYDEDVLEHVLRSPACYVGMVSSRKRAETCRDYLRASGLTDEQVAHFKAPAGLDLGAITPEEIAASILAELVQVRRSTRANSTGGHWTGGHWTGGHWTGGRWTGGHWTGGRWTGGRWTGGHWTGASPVPTMMTEAPSQDRGKPCPYHDDAGLGQAVLSGDVTDEHAMFATTVMEPEPGTEVDLVCGMQVEVATARHTLEYEGLQYYFCCPACKRLFAKNPQEYVGKVGEAHH